MVHAAKIRDKIIGPPQANRNDLSILQQSSRRSSVVETRSRGKRRSKKQSRRPGSQKACMDGNVQASRSGCKDRKCREALEEKDSKIEELRLKLRLANLKIYELSENVTVPQGSRQDLSECPKIRDYSFASRETPEDDFLFKTVSKLKARLR